MCEDKIIDEKKMKLWNLYFNNEPEYANNIGKKNKIKRYIRELSRDYLYRYRSFTENSIDDLENDCMFLTNPSVLNDPYECYFHLNHLDNVVVKDEYNNIIPSEKIMEESKDMQREMYIKVGIACFSEIKDSILMWSHYTSNHEGFCLEYNFKDLCNYILKREMFIFPAIYNDNIIKYDITDFTDSDKKNKTLSFIFNKACCWRYEKEWRLLSNFRIYPQRKAGERTDFLRPQSIYLGSNMSPENEKRIISIAKNKGIKVFKMQIKYNKYEVTPRLYNKIPDFKKGSN